MFQRDNITLQRTIWPREQLLKKAIANPQKAKAELCRRSFFYFLQEFWPEVSNDEFKPNWHIEIVCKELEILANRVANNLPKEYDLIINIPPGTTKTVTCSIMFPVWCWINWFWMRFITGSYSGPLSLESAEYSRDVVRSDRFIELFPELTIKQDKDTKSNFRVQKIFHNNIIKFGGNRYSTSVGGTVTGFHGHIIIIDDPINPMQAVSDTELKTANNWCSQTLSTRKIDKSNTPTVLMMQRLNQNDPSGNWLANKGRKIKHICLPGQIRDYKEEVRPQEMIQYYVDDLLDPVRMPWPVMNNMMAELGQYGFAGQVGQKPTPPGGGMFQVNMFIIVDNISGVVETVRCWDKAGTKDAGAYTVGCKMSLLKSGKWLITDIKRGQYGTHEREAIIRATAEADGVAVREYHGQEPGSGGKESAEATVRNLAGFSSHSERPIGDKIFRADPYSVQVNQGNVLLLRADWNHEFIEEHRFFPFSTYKDQVDAAAMCFSKLSRRRVAGDALRGNRQ